MPSALALNQEFADELSALDGKPYELISLDTIYTTLTGIAGQPLNDNNLGQSLINNYGRPYQEGFNNYTGFSARADDGRFSYYVSGEYQHSPSAPPYPLSARLAIAAVNIDPVQPAVPFPADQPVPPARHLRVHQVARPGHLSRQAKSRLGPERDRLDAVQRQRRTYLDAAHQPDRAAVYPGRLQGLRLVPVGQLLRQAGRSRPVPGWAVHLRQQAQLQAVRATTRTA